MLGIEYVSSDEEDVVSVVKPELPNTPIPPAPASVSKPVLVPTEENQTSVAFPEGPSQGPSATPLFEEDGQLGIAPPGSPYTSSRMIIQNLTLPTVPNLDIPPSPPGSPPQIATKKFVQFLELKKKGQHFNQRLENSSVARDPNHSRKLMEFAGLTDVDQYASVLPEGLGVRTVWPEWAYGDALNASQKKTSMTKESARSKIPRESVDFVPAKSSTSASIGIPSGKGSRQSAVERVIAGLDKRPKDR